MPVTMQILDNGRILHQIFSEPWDVRDLNRVLKESLDHYEKVDHPVHLITDVQGVHGIPGNVLQARGSAPITHPRAGYIVVVGAAGYIKSLADVISRLARFKRMKFCPTLEEAQDFLRSIVAEEMSANPK
jgi:hypothetical protein